jgi:hypothetical protein
MSLQTAAELLTQEVILQGRAGILVSYPEVDTEGMSKQDVEDRNIHAYAAIYKTEDIINWKITKIDGRMVPTLVVLKEIVDAPWNTKFETQQIDQYRVLEIDETGYYKQTIYYLESQSATIAKDTLAGAYPYTTYYPKMNGEPLTYIPFIPISVSGQTWEIERSPVEGIVNLNIAHYRNSSELEAGISLTASPTVVMSGYEVEKGKEVVLGGNNAITSSNADMQVTYLEYQGNGLNSISDAMKDKIKEMASLGLKILSSDQSVNEGAEAATINSHGPQSVLANIANSVSAALTESLRLMMKWDDPKANIDDVAVKLNTDFIPNTIGANLINSLIILWKSFGLSDQEMFEVLKRGEIIPAGMTFEEHQAQIKTSTAFTMFSELGEEAGGTDFLAPVHTNRLVDTEEPGKPNASKRLPTDSGGSNEGKK